MHALDEALREFDHHDESRHDEEIKCSADMILFQKLALALAIDSSSEEVPLICAALVMVYRASRVAVATSFDEIGMAVLPLIMAIIKRPQYSITQQEELPINHSSLVHVPDKMYPQYAYEAELQPHDGIDRIQPQFENREQHNVVYDTEKAANGENFSSNYDDFDADSDHDPQDYPSNYSGYSVEGTPDVPKADELTTQMTTSENKASEETTSDSNAEKNNTPESIVNEKPASEISTSEKESEKVDPTQATNLQQPNDDQYDQEMGQDDLSDVELISQFNEGIAEDKRATQNPGTDRQENSSTTETNDAIVTSDAKSHPEFQQDSYGPPSSTEEKQNYADSLLEMKPLPVNVTEMIGPSESAMNKMLKVLRYFSRVLNAMIPLAHSPGLIDAILYQIQRCSETDSYKGAERTEARIDAIAIVVNLACADDNKVTLTQDSAVLNTVIELARYDTSEKVREHATIVILNLSYADENKSKLANQKYLLSTLCKLMGDSSSYTRRYAAATLFTLAGQVTNSEIIATHEGGEILEALRVLLLDDPSDEARISASEALFIMTRSNSEAAVIAIANHLQLLDTLAQAVISDYNADVRAYAARALEWVASEIHCPMPCHQELLGALVKASQWTKTSSIAEAMKTQASLKDNRQAMGAHPGLLGALAGLALLEKPADMQTRSFAISAIERLSIEPANMQIMAKNSLIMTALTRASFSGSHEDQYEDEHTSSNAYLMKTALKNLAGYL